MSSHALRVWLWAGCCLLAATAPADETPALHERIDALVEAAAVGPLASPTTDADFLRRVYLDLTGTIPTSEEARAFLADASPDKRTKLIDQLLASPRYARHMALVFDVMLMERRPDKAVKTPEWQAYLHQSFADNKPLDQLCRELITADGTDAALRPATRFLLDRSCEPNAVTRDAGRMFFGMDLQCAQCHDHPTIDHYLQEDYYGLFAFFLRSSAFTDAKKKQTLVAEKADGEANFKSVFTDNASDRVAPRLPHGPTAADDPVFAKGEEYVSAPAKNVRGVPKHSRRAQLAAMLTDSQAFRRNLANRVWAHLFGRGIVHPVDAHHADNPPTHPQVLVLLADEFARSKYDLKGLLRELARTRAYQRSCEPPPADSIAMLPANDLATRIAALESERVPIEQRLKERETALKQAQDALRTAREGQQKQQAALVPLAAEAKAADEALAKAVAARKQADEANAKKEQQVTAVAEAAKKAEAAAKLLAGDEALAEAAATIAARSQVVRDELDAALQAAAELAKQTESATEKVRVANEALASARKTITPHDQLASIEQTMLDLQSQAHNDRYELASLDERISLGKAIADYQKLAQSDPSAASQAWPALVDRWTTAGQVTRLRQLSCEQFALSLLQAGGTLAQRHQAAVAALEKSPPPELKDAPEADHSRIAAKLAEEQVFGQVRGNLNAFVSLYATQFADDFQATVNQALFFENDSVVQSLLGPSGGNLTDRLTKIEDPAQLADELYLSTLTRFPTEAERSDVASHLHDRSADRPTAVGELVWALLSSNEFRFNH